MEITEATHLWFSDKAFKALVEDARMAPGDIKYFAFIVRDPRSMQIECISDGTPRMEDIWALCCGDDMYRAYESKDVAESSRMLRGLEENDIIKFEFVNGQLVVDYETSCKLYV